MVLKPPSHVFSSVPFSLQTHGRRVYSSRLLKLAVDAGLALLTAGGGVVSQ